MAKMGVTILKMETEHTVSSLPAIDTMETCIARMHQTNTLDKAHQSALPSMKRMTPPDACSLLYGRHLNLVPLLAIASSGQPLATRAAKLTALRGNGNLNRANLRPTLLAMNMLFTMVPRSLDV